MSTGQIQRPFQNLLIKVNLVFLFFCIVHNIIYNKSQKGLPLETKNTQNDENRRLGLIESHHMQLCSLRGCICPLAEAVFDFQNNQYRLNDPKGNKI